MNGSGPGLGLILIVDDEPAITQLLRLVLEAKGQRVVVAGDGQAAMDRVAERRPDLVILDVNLPRVGGFEVCERLKSSPETRLIPILMLTGSAIDDRMRAWDLGADEFLTKPFQSLEVVARCRSLLRQKDLVDALDSAESVVFALARAIEAKSPFTHGHSGRVTRHALSLAAKLALGEPEIDVLRRGAALHDIGKLSMPDSILNKPEPLTPEEFEVARRHPEDGAKIVEPLRSARDVISLIRWHHERMDGGGYPDGIAGGAIPLLVRILSVADVYDALASERPYRPAMPHEQCRAVMTENAAAGGLDPELVRVFFDPTFGSRVATPPGGPASPPGSNPSRVGVRPGSG
ncbi:HD-GYP domain-containing protein [Paludisphaera mucosa]|uniref:Response regulator n=1 Tax=Paludisphaera mucosa TaxID=3030827 RepID=A0ABT6FDK4_9BACT|nr:HD domain-containing phosphohydrolase [Paludisphaera mucosa]MDG3005473.1 response regulator [Paludisphaera mucosa]